MAQADLNNDPDEVSIRDLILKVKYWCNYLLSKWKLIIVAGVLGGALGIIYAFLTKPIYKAEMTFALEDDKSNGSLGSAIGLASQFGLDLGDDGGGAFTGDNLIELLRSRSMVEKALLSTVTINGKPTTLANHYINFNELGKAWQKNATQKAIDFPVNSDRSKFSLKQDSVLGVFYRTLIKDNLYVDKVDKKLSIITVRVSSKNELFSKLFAEQLVKTVSDFYVDTKTKKSIQTVATLQHQIDSVRHELYVAIAGVATATDNNPNSNPALQILRTPSQKRQVDVQANTAILTELVKSIEVSKMSLRKETPLIQVIDKPILPLEKDKIGKARGLVIGGIIGGFLMIIILTVKLLYKKAMAVNTTLDFNN